IEHEHFGPSDERAPDRKHLLLATRKRSTLLSLALIQERKQFVDVLEPPRYHRTIFHHVSTQKQILVNRHGAKNPAALRYVNETSLHDIPRLTLGDVSAVKLHRAGLRVHE